MDSCLRILQNTCHTKTNFWEKSETLELEWCIYWGMELFANFWNRLNTPRWHDVETTVSTSF